MRKSYAGCRKDEVVIKVNVEVAKAAFQPPVVEQHVIVNDWKSGVDIDDVKFEENWITEEEAEVIREKRLLKMKDILENQGYEVSAKETE